MLRLFNNRSVCCLTILAVVAVAQDYGLVRHCSLLESLPYNLFSHRRGVGEVVSIEAIVAKFVDNNLVGREIGCIVLLAQLLHSKQQSSFTKLVAVGTIGIVTHRADGKKNLDTGRLQPLHNWCPGVDNIFHSG